MLQTVPITISNEHKLLTKECYRLKVLYIFKRKCKYYDCNDAKIISHLQIPVDIKCKKSTKIKITVFLIRFSDIVNTFHNYYKVIPNYKFTPT